MPPTTLAAPIRTDLAKLPQGSPSAASKKAGIAGFFVARRSRDDAPEIRCPERVSEVKAQPTNS
jgi:hypothetical protein